MYHNFTKKAILILHFENKSFYILRKTDFIYLKLLNNNLTSYTIIFQGGINKGYTELLTRRYFTKDYIASTTYKYETTIIEKLEEIIEQEKWKVYT